MRYLSINQQDDEEKSWQVQQMRDVYGNASLVLVWLGPAGDTSDIAMEKLRTFGEEVASETVLKFWDLRYRLYLWIGYRVPVNGNAQPTISALSTSG